MTNGSFELKQERATEARRHHYEVERELAAQLRKTSRSERTVMFKTLYNELFERVPDHPRLVKRDSPEMVQRRVAAQLGLLNPWLDSSTTLVEFAPGDCRLSYSAAGVAKEVIGIDISDQSGKQSESDIPGNFRLIVYDGYHVDLPDVFADLLFSYQFLEHLHPDDVDEHIQLAAKLLKPGGRYVFSTPHRFSGPHDISRFFSSEPTGFHFQEWTYGGLFEVLKKNGFSSAHSFRFGKPRQSALWNAFTLGLEKILGMLPRKLQIRLSQRIFESVVIVATR